MATNISPQTSLKRMVRIGQLVKQARHTTNDVVSILDREFPMYKHESNQNIISHSKNPKFNELHSLITENKEGILQFSR